MKRFLSLLVLALTGLLWAGGSSGIGGVARAEELKIGMTQFPSTLNPNIDAMLAKSYVLAMTRRPVTAYDQNWELVCMLCTELPTLENGLAVREELEGGGQGIAVTYKLHPEATWGDGVPVTAADAVFTWEVGRHPLSGVADLEPYRRILSIDVVDDKTYTVHVDRITYDYSSAGGFDLLPAHIERPIFEANPAEYRNRTTFDADPSNPGLGFGPYRISEVVSGSSISLVPNKTWWGRKPAFERITVQIIENTAALEANLLSGALDMIAGELGLTIDQALAFERRHGKKFDILYKPGLVYEHIDLNLANPILRDIRVRRALLYALDREALSQKLFQGRQPVADGPVSPLDWVHAAEVPRYPYDPERAKALLDEAGWSTMKNGIRHNAAGESLTLQIMTTAGNRSRELVEQVLQSQWKQVGIDMRIRNEPARVFFGQTVSQRKFPALAMFAWLSAPESVPRSTLHSESIPTVENNWAGQNYTGYANPAMDTLLEAIEQELNREERALLWRDLQRLYAEELPVLPLYWRATPYVLPKWLKGVRPTGHLGTTTLWIEEWSSQGR